MGTVAARRNRILEVFGVKTIYEAGQKAIKLGLLSGHFALQLQNMAPVAPVSESGQDEGQ